MNNDEHASAVLEILSNHLTDTLHSLYTEHGLDYLVDEHGQVVFFIEQA